MRHARIALAALAVATLTVGAVQGRADARPIHTLPACKFEDGSGQRANCVWDGRHRGNGEGHSYIAVTRPGRDDRFIRISHRYAHQLTH